MNKRGKEKELFICNADDHILAMTIKTLQIHPHIKNVALFHHLQRVSTVVNLERKIHIKRSTYTRVKFLDTGNATGNTTEILFPNMFSLTKIEDHQMTEF